MREYAELSALLPHRHPVLLVDRVLHVEPGVRIQTVKAVTGSEPCYATAAGGCGYPPTLLLESFVQSAALLWALSPGGVPNGDTLVLGGVRNAVFHATAYPGDVVRHEVELTQVVGSNAILTGRSQLGERDLLTVRSVVLARRPAPVPAGAR